MEVLNTHTLKILVYAHNYVKVSLTYYTFCFILQWKYTLFNDTVNFYYYIRVA